MNNINSYKEIKQHLIMRTLYVKIFLIAHYTYIVPPYETQSKLVLV